MKNLIQGGLFLLAVVASSFGQTQPRVFITDSDSWQIDGLHGGARPQSAEIAKTFLERCPAVRVNNRKEISDYVVVLNHEGGKGYGQKDNKVAVYNNDGDLIYGGSTKILGNAVKDACASIASDWSRKKNSPTAEAVRPVGAVSITMHRTERHERLSKPEVAFTILDDVTAHLKDKKVQVVSDPELADYHVDLEIDRPTSKWVKVTVKTTDSTGKQLWQGVAEDGSWTTMGSGGLEATLKKLNALLDDKFQQHSSVATQ